MKVELLDGLTPRVVHATRVLVTADDGTPLSLAVEVSPGVIALSHAGESDFQRTLTNFGIDRTVVTEELRPRSLDGS